MSYAIELFNSFKLSKIYYYMFITLMAMFLILEKFVGIDIPLFYVSEENAGMFILSLVAIGMLAYKSDMNSAEAQAQANENALAAIAISANIKLEDLKKQIEDIKALKIV
mgnify:CR=1 FL=1